MEYACILYWQLKTVIIKLWLLNLFLCWTAHKFKEVAELEFLKCFEKFVRLYQCLWIVFIVIKLLKNHDIKKGSDQN